MAPVTGSRDQAATLSGVKVKSVVFWISVNMGVLSALAGVIFAGRLNQAGPTAGTSFELDAIAAAFIGGAVGQGGVGKVIGAITGGLIMTVINNGMSIRHLYNALVVTPAANIAHILRWSYWCRRHQYRAQQAHYQRQSLQEP